MQFYNEFEGKPLPVNRMGSEGLIEAIRFAVTVHRPSKVLELGVGLTTLFLLPFLRELEALIRQERDRYGVSNFEGQDIVDPTWSWTNELSYIGVDMGTGSGSLFEKVSLTVQEFEFASLFQQDFKRFLANNDESFDLVIVDIGAPSDNLIILNELLPRLNPGGILIMHEPLELQVLEVGAERHVSRGLSIAWNLFKFADLADFEMITFPELHKTAQAGVGIVRRRTAFELTRDPQQFLRELSSCQDVPLFNVKRLTQVGNLKSKFQARKAPSNRFESRLNHLGDQVFRLGKKLRSLVFSNVLGDSHEFSTIAFIDGANCGSSTGRGGKQVDERTSLVRLQHLADRFFLAGEWYTESEVDWMLSYVTPHPAELRQQLFDSGFLEINSSQLIGRANGDRI